MCSVGVARIVGFEENGFPTGHPMKRERAYLALKVLKEAGVLDLLELVEFERDDGDDCVDILRLFHEEAYIRFVKKMSNIGEGLLDYGDTPCFPKCYETFAHVAKASSEMCKMLGKFEHVVNLYGGLHHAHPNRASGFCVFNDVGVAIKMLRSKGLKIAYIDIDAHHGDGVMYNFYSDRDVLIVDFHEDGRHLFPGTGYTYEMGEGKGFGTKVNIVLQPYACDADYIYAFKRIVPHMIREFKPDVLLLQAGVDAHIGDPLTHLELSDSGYFWLVSSIHRLSHEVCGGRLALFGGGGYSLGSVARCWAGAVCEAVGVGRSVAVGSVAKKVFEEGGHVYDDVGVSPTRTAVSSETKRTVDDVLRRLSEAGWSLAVHGGED